MDYTIYNYEIILLTDTEAITLSKDFNQLNTTNIPSITPSDLEVINDTLFILGQSTESSIVSFVDSSNNLITINQENYPHFQYSNLVKGRKKVFGKTA